MINVIIPIIDDVENWKNFIENRKETNIKFFVGIKENLFDKFDIKLSNVEVHKFSNNSKKEEMINSLHTCKMKKGKLLITRRPLTDEEFVALTTSNKDITTLKARHNKFVSAFKSFISTIIRKIFAFSYFEDISAICYKENMFELLSVCQNLSMASRVNKYVGVEIEEIITKEKAVKRDYNKTKNAFSLILGLIILLGSVAGGVCVCLFTPLIALTVILVIFWIFAALTIFMTILVNFSRTIAVGELRYGRAEEK